MKKLLGTLLAVVAAIPIAAHATPIRLDSTVTPAFAGIVTSWSIDFFDTGDGILQIGEITGFSGVTLLTSSIFYDTVINVPNLPGISSGSGFIWSFSAPGGAELNASAAPGDVYNYALTPVAVPEASTLSLIVLGLMGIGFARARRKTV